MVDSVGLLNTVLLAVCLSVARVLAFLLICPFFSFRHIKKRLQVAVALSLCMLIVPVMYEQLASRTITVIQMIPILFKEVVAGFMLGFITGFPYWLFQCVGSLLDSQSGVMMGGQLNPEIDNDYSPFGFMLKGLMRVMVIIGPGLFSITQVLWHSYDLWPILAWTPRFSAQGFILFLTQIGHFFSYVILYAAPILFVLILIDLVLGIANITNQQLPATSLAIPFKCLAVAFLFLLSHASFTHLMNTRIDLFADLADMMNLILTK
ncbi:EscT/YscT/HrcT family type III secretion system export apparatus protein [Enterobacteriaceae bacterium RIT693]|nr:EscT/YscT/HrcT family type III secretion system export apparatus protein [Enterobacteriaceae bacterium RIT693]